MYMHYAVELICCVKVFQALLVLHNSHASHLYKEYDKKVKICNPPKLLEQILRYEIPKRVL